MLLAGVLLDEAIAGDEEAARTHRWVIDATTVGFQHLHDQTDDALGGVILAALFAFGEGELAKEVFVDVAEDVLAVQA